MSEKMIEPLEATKSVAKHKSQLTRAEFDFLQGELKPAADALNNIFEKYNLSIDTFLIVKDKKSNILRFVFDLELVSIAK